MLGVIASRLGVTVTEMAREGRISRTAMGRLLMNEWPVKTERETIKAGLQLLLQERGATTGPSGFLCVRRLGELAVG
jgi:hypothetical protein